MSHRLSHLGYVVVWRHVCLSKRLFEVRPRLRAGPAGRLIGALRHYWNTSNRKYGASKLRFPCAKEFIRKLSTIFGAQPRIYCPVLGRKSLKNVGLKGRQIISPPGAPTGLGSALAEVSQK